MFYGRALQESECSKELRKQRKELRRQVLAYGNIKLHSKFSLLKVLLSNFILPPRTKTVSLPFLFHSTALFSVFWGDKECNTTTLLRDNPPWHQGVLLAEQTASFSPVIILRAATHPALDPYEKTGFICFSVGDYHGHLDLNPI